MTKVADSALLERRAKRERRREKQRAASIDCAKKMHAARLALAEEKSHYLPSKVNSPIQHDSQFQVGCSGWFYWHWRGGFYPADMPNTQWFDHYSRHFSTVELNAPFYSWPTIATVKSWLQQVDGKEFLFTVKACELMTHTKRFIGTKELVRDFGFIADLLGPHMGCFLFQLPPSYRYAPARLKTIVNQLDPNWRNVVEFRHASWWNEKVYKAFETAGIIFCSSSAPKLPDELIKTSDEIYIRFHGAKRWYRHNYTGEELNSWSGRIRNSGAKRVWAYFNNDRDGSAINNAQELLRLLNSPHV